MCCVFEQDTYTLTVPCSTQVYKWVLVKLLLGVGRRNKKYLLLLHAMEMGDKHQPDGPVPGLDTGGSCKQLEKEGILTKTTSGKLASPLVPVVKPNESIRSMWCFLGWSQLQALDSAIYHPCGNCNNLSKTTLTFKWYV